MGKDAGPSHLIRMEGISKRFGPVIANDGIDFDLLPGEIHALVGENGAGKSTLMRVLYGLVRADSGRISVGGSDVAIRTPGEAIRLGIGMVQQRAMLVGALSVAENIVLGREPALGIFLDRRRAKEEAARALSLLGSRVRPEAPASSLSAAERQTAEIAKLIHADARVVILDEPTSYLSPSEVRDLFSLVRNLKNTGRSVVFISHKLGEVLEIADRLTVLRRGRVQAVLRGSEASEEILARLVVGEERLEQQASATYPAGEVTMEVQNLTVADGRVRDVSLSVRAGEVLGIAGLAGNGQRELVAGILGLVPRRSGRVRLRAGRLGDADPARLLSTAVAHVPEEAFERGLLPGLSVEESLVLGMHRTPAFSRGGWMRWRAIGEHAERLLADFDIRATRRVMAEALSGGNQQKVVLARELSRDAEVFVLEQPTRGLDMRATRLVRGRIRALRAAGKALLLVSYDLDELLELCDRIAVLLDGRVVGVRPRSDLTRESLGRLMTGVGAGMVR